MNEKEFKTLLLQAGFKTKKEFSDFLDINKDTISQWGRRLPFPKWLKWSLENAAKAKKYEDILKDLKP